jgi:hypothetical protein
MQVSKFEQRISFLNTKASKPQPSSPSSSVPDNRQLEVQQPHEDRAVAAAANASEPQAPFSPVPEARSKEPASPFDLGLRASQLSMYCRHVQLQCSLFPQTHASLSAPRTCL